MDVTIKTKFGDLSFDLSPLQVAGLIQQAVEYAIEPHLEADVVTPADVLPGGQMWPQENPCTDSDSAIVLATKLTGTVTAARNSRVSAMFGDKAGWDMPAKDSKPEKEPEPPEELRETYTGFIYARCGACGKEKGYCAKVPIDHHKCVCGHETHLRELRIAVVECECGSRFHYRTNIRDKQFSINCINCGTPVDLELNKDWTGYKTIR